MKARAALSKVRKVLTNAQVRAATPDPAGR
jgi:hypothetical protein